MLKKYFPLISGFLLLTILISFLLHSPVTPALGIVLLLLTHAVSVSSIFDTHKASENSRPKIVRDVAILIIAILVIVSIGGLAGLFVGQYAGAYIEVRWQGMGMAAELVSAVVVGLVVGYAIRRGMEKLGWG